MSVLVDPTNLRLAWHDVTCPEGRDCPDRTLHSLATQATVGLIEQALDLCDPSDFGRDRRDVIPGIEDDQEAPNQRPTGRDDQDHNSVGPLGRVAQGVRTTIRDLRHLPCTCNGAGRCHRCTVTADLNKILERVTP